MRKEKIAQPINEKIYSIDEQLVIEIDKLHDEIWKFDESIKSLEILLEKSSAEEEIEATQKKQS